MLYLLAASVIWAFSFGLIGNLLAGLPPAWIASARLVVAAAVFLPFARRVPVRMGASLFAAGTIQFGVMSLAYISSFRYLKSHEVALFTVMTPVYVSVANDLLSRKFHAANLLAAVLAVSGAGIILWKGVTSKAPLLGFLLVEASNVCFAVGQLAYREIMRRNVRPIPDRGAFFWLYLGGLAAMLPLGLRDATSLAPHPTGAQLATLIYLGAVVSGVSYFLWNSGARRVPVGVLAVMNNLKIPLGVAASLFVFGERTSLAGLLAGGVLVAAALVPVLAAKRGRESD